MLVNNRTYRGNMRIAIWNGSLVCVNVLPIEEYLWGVVPGEVPNQWHIEVLKAQAVAARTYSLRALEQYPDRPFDVYSTVIDQAYEGAGWERESTTRACSETFGEVCVFNGTPIIAYYHAASGGWTASGWEMFGHDLPYLCPVQSRDSNVHRWVYRISPTELASALNRAGYSVGNIQRVWVHRFSYEGRADEVKIVHSSGVLLISGAELRPILGPANIKTTYFTVEGQTAPEIPNTPNSGIGRTGSFPEKYSLANSQVLVPLPKPLRLSSWCVITGHGLQERNSIKVIGCDDSTEYIDGYVWTAEPSRAGNPLSNPAGLPRSEFVFFGSDETDVIEDPGENIGIPINGMIVFKGTGMGHGVGMSQHGARILAESGWKYTEILTYFYTGIDINRFY
ncbi:MAG TPA: SpoIID/LytB domain-containing protein [Firmicutes bacterium]|nr:SpoIID/LytB domain-containing protein [Bacillota bacterium]